MDPKMILHPTATAQWQALIQDAASHGQASLSEDLESYLVFMLMRFMGESRLGSQAIAFEYLRGLDLLPKEREDVLRDVGDKCLLFAGFFPDLAKRRRVKLDYYVRLGQTAYATLSTHPHQALSQLFNELSEQFVSLMDILHWMRSLGENGKATETLDLISAEELWRDTQSQYAKAVLQKQVPHLSIPFPTDITKRH